MLRGSLSRTWQLRRYVGNRETGATSSGNKYEMGGAQAAAVGHAHIVTELYKKYRETFDLPK